MSDVFYDGETGEIPPPALTARIGRFGDVAKLAAALAKAQGQIEDATKDSINPHFRNKYADLAAVRAAIRGPLSENGIAYVQLVRTAPKSVAVETLLIHESGQSIGETLEIPLLQSSPQAVGSAISYGRRYSLMSIVGLAADDDDAETAQGRNGNGQEARSGARPKRSQAEISAAKKGKEDTHAEFENDLLDVHSLHDLAKFEETWAHKLSGEGGHVWTMQEKLERKRQELVEAGDEEERMDYVRNCLAVIEEAKTRSELAQWWESGKTMRRELGLSKEQVDGMKKAVEAKRDSLPAAQGTGIYEAGTGRELSTAEAG